MDEGLLNDLLECSVCLERLDTSSRVLPCQHTFCLKCLKVIVESHKELRCPECRVLVEVKVEELPPNVLLMRILEGMKNSAPRKPVGQAAAHRAARVAQMQQVLQAHQQAVQHQPVKNSDGKTLPPHARALHDYRSKEIGDLPFKKGETILLQKRLDPFWYQGECSGRSGIFPITYVQVIVPLHVPTALCKALYDFRMSAPDEEGCLAFDKGAIIAVHRRVDENWAEGRIEERIGIFPIAFVELNTAARQLMNSPTLNRPVPPLPDHARAGHSDHRHHPQHPHRYQMSMSTPTTGQTYQNVATMSQSQPTFNQSQPLQPQVLTPQPIANAVTSHGMVVQRSILEPQKLELIHIQKGQTMGLQSAPRINEFDRLRTSKYENFTLKESTYQNIRAQENFPIAVANFNAANSSDSSSSVNTPLVSSATTPNSSSCESAEPSLPSSPDNGERTAAAPTNNAIAQTNETEDNPDINTSMGVLSLNESSTATNTSLNVSLPPSDSPIPKDDSNKNEPSRLDIPCSSKVQNPRSSGPESLLNFGIGLQAALSPSHSKDMRKDKRHSLTPTTHLNASQHTPNRHSAEILATSLLDHVPERDRDRSDRERERERRRRRSRSNERPLPATYIALYPYKPQKTDELELKKGAMYTVTERCRDGWYKGCSERTQRCGVFPGNYVAAANIRPKHDKPAGPSSMPVTKLQQNTSPAVAVPDAPPRAPTPQPSAAQPQLPYPWGTGSQQSTPKVDKSKEKAKLEKTSISSGVSLMKRLAAMKKCKSPPPTYSMDNPVFEDGPGTSLVLNSPAQTHPVHVRSGSCPSQLLRSLPSDGRASHRVRARERPTVMPHEQPGRSAEYPWQSQHRKSQSLDVTATKRDRDRSQPVKERFRCIVPYPPNSEYELELKVDDIVMVHRKRGDGWYKGTLQRTGRTGLFPASFVQSCPAE